MPEIVFPVKTSPPGKLPAEMVQEYVPVPPVAVKVSVKELF